MYNVKRIPATNSTPTDWSSSPWGKFGALAEVNIGAL